MALVPFPDSSAPDEAPPDDATDADPGKMSFLDHLDELRKRLIITAIALLGGFLLCFAFINPIFDFIMRPLQEILPDGGRLVYTEPTEAFFLYIKVAALAGLVLATPVVLAQLWLFVAPGLYAHEKRFAIPFVILATGFSWAVRCSHTTFSSRWPGAFSPASPRTIWNLCRGFSRHFLCTSSSCSRAASCSRCRRSSSFSRESVPSPQGSCPAISSTPSC